MRGWIILLLLAGCGKGTENTPPALLAAIHEAQACESDDECRSIAGSCSLGLGCAVYVRIDRADEIIAAIEAAEADYREGTGPFCEYDCAPPRAAVCTRNQCAAMHACGAGFCADDQYCVRYVSDVSGEQDRYDCETIPAECMPDPDCACLADQPCGDRCSGNAISGNFLLTCPGG